ncbi:MAG: hypothetical protein HWE30_09560 [Methylocystaceae bacterium]|nr:hypothetical protein [Methylocystaceae bacterium]
MSLHADHPTKARSLVEFTNEKTGVLSLTDKIEADNSHLTKASCRTDIDFMVQYKGYWFAVHADQVGTQALLRVHGIIGNLPFSYQSSFARNNIMAVVSRASRAIKGKVRVDDQQRILLIDEVRVEGSLSPKLILAETTKVLLKLKPYLELVNTLRPPTSAKFKAPTNYRKQEVIQPEPVANDPVIEPHSHPIVKARIKLKPKPKAKMKLMPKKKKAMTLKVKPKD